MNPFLIVNRSLVAITAVICTIGCSTSNPKTDSFGLDAAPNGVVGSPSQAKNYPAIDKSDTGREVSLNSVARPLQGVSSDTQGRLKIAEDAYARSNWALAIREFKFLTSVYTRNTQIWFALGSASALAGNYADAASAFETVIDIDSQDVRASYNLSLIRIAQAEIALMNAQSGSGNASVELRQQILRLSSDLSNAFKRTAVDKNSVLEKPQSQNTLPSVTLPISASKKPTTF
jgi:tetratricopeptide (TPR) repeat protein